MLEIKNLKIVTDNNKNIYIKDILSFFKILNNKKKILSKIYFNKKLFLSSFESLIPISFNKKYWESSNYFLLKNIIHGFFHNNILTRIKIKNLICHKYSMLKNKKL